MTIQKIVAGVNQLLADERLTYNQMQLFLNQVIDDINTDLCATFPEFEDNATEYTAFPDKYIRSVVLLGAAYKYYIMDEEGTVSAKMYAQMYTTNLFLMCRDYSCQVPEEYQDYDRGYVSGPTETETETTINPMWEY